MLTYEQKIRFQIARALNFSRADALHYAKFDESKHPRNKGKFASKGGGDSGAKKEPAKVPKGKTSKPTAKKNTSMAKAIDDAPDTDNEILKAASKVKPAADAKSLPPHVQEVVSKHTRSLMQKLGDTAKDVAKLVGGLGLIAVGAAAAAGSAGLIWHGSEEAAFHADIAEMALSYAAAALFTTPIAASATFKGMDLLAASMGVKDDDKKKKYQREKPVSEVKDIAKKFYEGILNELAENDGPRSYYDQIAAKRAKS